MKQLAVAFRACTPGVDEAERPDCLALPITNSLMQSILNAQTFVRQYGFEEIAIRCWFYTPSACVDDDVEEAVAENDWCPVDTGLFENIDEQRVDCMTVVVDGTFLHLSCYDHYCDYLIESPCVGITEVLGATL